MNMSRNPGSGPVTSSSTAFTRCPKCKESELILKPTKFGTLFIACAGFPACKNAMGFPKNVKRALMLPTGCDKCWRQNNAEVKKFKIEFAMDELSPNAEDIVRRTNGIFCVFDGCDDLYGTLVDLSRTTM